jgi:hypothetical protein
MQKYLRNILAMTLIMAFVTPCWAAKKEGKAAADAPKKDIKGLDVPKYDGKPADMSKKVKIFVIMGQSNAVGMGKPATLEAAVKEGKKYPYMNVGEAMGQAMVELLKK